MGAILKINSHADVQTEDTDREENRGRPAVNCLVGKLQRRVRESEEEKEK